MKSAASWLADLLRMPLAFLFSAAFCAVFAGLSGGVLRPVAFTVLGGLVFAGGKAAQARKEKRDKEARR